MDGIYGGLTPRGEIYMDIFIEKNVSPEFVTHKIEETGELGGEIDKKVENGILREVECSMIMNIDMAKSLRKWLDDKITDREKLLPTKNKVVKK